MANQNNPAYVLRANGFVADTSVLMLPLLFSYLDTENISEQVRTKLINKIVAAQHRSVPRLEEQCRKYFESGSPVIIITQTIPEINGHVQSRDEGKGKLGLTEQSYSSFWKHSFDYIGAHFEEECIRIDEIAADTNLRRIACEIGPVDAALIAIARRRALPILTSDRRTLMAWANEVNVPAIHLDDILLWT